MEKSWNFVGPEKWEPCYLHLRETISCSAWILC